MKPPSVSLRVCLKKLEKYWHGNSKSNLRKTYMEQEINGNLTISLRIHVYSWLSLHYERVKVKLLSHVWLFVTPWTVAYQASLSMGFSSQEYWSGLPFSSPGESSQSRDQTQISHSAGRDTLPSKPKVWCKKWHEWRVEVMSTPTVGGRIDQHILWNFLW